MNPRQVVVMGVSGCGKSTVGHLLARTLGADFVEGDLLHDPANVAKMRAGTPLTDADRAGWLAAIAHRLGEAAHDRRGLVVSCSALKHSYRDQLRAAAPALRLVWLQGDLALLRARLAARRDHYMPPTLLDSQLATLEPPGAGEDPITLDWAHDPATLVAQARARLVQETAR